MFLSTKPRQKISLPINLLKSTFSLLNFRHLNTYSFTRFQSLIFLFILFLVVFLLYCTDRFLSILKRSERAKVQIIPIIFEQFPIIIPIMTLLVFLSIKLLFTHSVILNYTFSWFSMVLNVIRRNRKKIVNEANL
jgi:hypothetical protein